jgi:hypothetical protein
MAAGGWWLVVGSWLLAVGSWLLVMQITAGGLSSALSIK